MAWAALTFVTSIREQSCSIRVLHCGGTIRACQKAAVKYNQQLLILLNDSRNKGDSDMEEDERATGFGVRCFSHLPRSSLINAHFFLILG